MNPFVSRVSRNNSAQIAFAEAAKQSGSIQQCVKSGISALPTDAQGLKSSAAMKMVVKKCAEAKKGKNLLTGGAAKGKAQIRKERHDAYMAAKSAAGK